MAQCRRIVHIVQKQPCIQLLCYAAALHRYCIFLFLATAVTATTVATVTPFRFLFHCRVSAMVAICELIPGPRHRAIKQVLLQGVF